MLPFADAIVVGHKSLAQHLGGGGGGRKVWRRTHMGDGKVWRRTHMGDGKVWRSTYVEDGKIQHSTMWGGTEKSCAALPWGGSGLV